MYHPKYRPDIDGLRAVAVLSVVGFHAFPSWIKGGFVGVDIFFVISGFLISTIIFANLERNNFSFLEFYSRRIKRIFPALLVVLIASLAFGNFVLSREEFAQLGLHIAGGAGFVSNVILWQESGYFDNIAITKPLLNLWSLAIEEQFYIFWPMILAFVWKRNWGFVVITASIALTSFAVNLYLTKHDPVASFYLPFPRFWELMAGGLLAYIVLHQPQWTSRYQNAQSILGLILVTTGLLLLDNDSSFPGAWASLPVLGAFFIISANRSAWFNRHVLSNKGMVWFGLISYPLYLWHWPILSFARIMEGAMPSREFRIAAVILSIFLAWLTFVLVEKPIRFSWKIKGKSMALLMLMVLVGSIGYLFSRPTDYGVHQQTGPNSKIITFHCPSNIEASMPFLNFCKTSADTAPSAALVGDSHADHLFPGIPIHDPANRWILLGVHSCPPAIGIYAEGSNPGCAEKVSALFDYLVKNRDLKLVVLSFFGQYAAKYNYNADAIQRKGPGENRFILRSESTSNKSDTFYLGLNNSIRLLMNSGKQVIIILDVPEFPIFPSDCKRMFAADYAERCSIPRSDLVNRQSIIRGIVARLKKNYPGLLVYDPIDLLCDGSRCYAFDRDTGLSNYRDSHHLSEAGSNLVGQDVIRWLSNNASNK